MNINNAMKTFPGLMGVWMMFCLLSACTSIQKEGLTLRSADGWDELGLARWTWSASGEVVAIGGDGFLVSEDQYSEYELRFEFNVEASTNSGVLIHCVDPAEITPLTCYEINIWDEHPQQENRTGAIVTRVPPLVSINTLGRWNDYRLVVSLTELKVYLNGELVSVLANPERAKGHIALQRAEGGTARFRNFSISPLRDVH